MSGEDGDIDDLLDSALEDFDNLPKPKVKSKVSQATPAVPCPTEEDFMAIFAAAGLSQGGGEISDLPPGGMKEELDKLARLAVEAEGEADTVSVEDRLSQTIKQMTKNSEGLSGQPSEEELQAMFSNMGMGEGTQPGFDNLIPMMEGMMQSLLSKELLYPAMKDIADKFPDWLADNRTKISEEEYNKHNKQYDLTKRICFKFEEEKEEMEESDEVKKARFDQIMSLMQEMQSLGHPPKELTGDSSPAFQFDAEGNPILPGLGDPSQCCLQ
eukprot:TRINITY_DN20001_c2_g1_i1.p1 TRINITY_DN20001_c2_g1~~TRINITY_DN20001_c2_g1_i1.p1  ORF type:complete len:286 (+),score=121.85 TRINITY_DN20001_c2_g1_i1:49-858(+)